MALTAQAVLLALPCPAAAADCDAPLERGVQQFNQARFQRALKVLQGALGTRCNRRTRARIHLHLGFCHGVLGDRAAARAAFELALRADPSISVDRGRMKADLVNIFDEVRREIGATGVRPPAAAPATRRVWTWVAAGGAVAALAAGLGLWAWAESDHDEFLATPDPLRYDELKSSIRARDTGAVVLFSVAGALTATAAALFFLEGRRGPRRERAFVPRLRIGPTGVALEMRLP